MFNFEKQFRFSQRNLLNLDKNPPEKVIHKFLYVMMDF